MAALFIIAGALYERTHTRDLDRLGGLWTTVPKMGAMGLFFAMASLGLPGLGNFFRSEPTQTAALEKKKPDSPIPPQRSESI